MTLSTSNPVLTGSAPELQTWYLSYYTNTYDRATQTNTTNGSIRGTVYDDETYEPIPFANIALYQNGNVSNGTMTDLEGQYVIKPVQAGNYELECSYVGYNSHKIPSLYVNGNTPIQQDIYLNSSMMVLAECQVVDYKVNLIDKEEPSNMTISYNEIEKMPATGGVSAKYCDVYVEEDAYYYELKSQNYKTTNYISNTVKNTVANLEYKIDIPYTIPSDGKNYDIKIKDVELDVEYIYHAVPKVEEEVFLSAQITDWTDLNLLSGESSIYYNGTFTGE
ncbi:MAG: hypothetical protein C0596_13940 [Marinilabiliales bacterium]|nr:MAG: hypothetical protein C0596_13940 [Marinilabiliales bacterium]